MFSIGRRTLVDRVFGRGTLGALFLGTFGGWVILGGGTLLEGLFLE